MSAEAHKAAGNKLFSQQLYEDAVKEYSTAICQNPTVATYYTNRALCHLKLKRFDDVVADCNRAVDIDERAVKGYYLKGQALTEKKRYAEALTDLKKAYQLSLEEPISYTADILHALLHARRKKWETDEVKRMEQESELLRYMKMLINKDRQSQKALLRRDDRRRHENIDQSQDERLSQIESIFEQADENLKKRDVPDYFVDKISFNIMHDPVITTSGITYERDSLRNHFRRIGYFDPLTRRPCTEEALIPNLSLKEAIEDFIIKNGWAADY